ncbi:MAG TPA: hypothetical protein VHE55_11140 [Fimbriimonadaceae bacterium]|nr:hypothetical protein [Fimbriimonadaceae bacterium]
MLTIYKPGQMPVRGLRTSLQGAQLGDGYFQAISNLRWDTGALTVRDAVANLMAGGSPVATPGTVCLGAWSGPLNGTYYVVSAWVVGGATAIYTYDLAAGTFTEITDVGGSPPTTWGGDSTGKTRLSSTTDDVTFCVHTMPRRVIAGAIIPAVDVLSINNLTDYPLIWNPTATAGLRVIQHKNVRAPSGGGTQFNYFATLSTFFPVASSSGKSYVSKQVNGSSSQTTYQMADTTAAPYTSSNTCIKFTVNAPADGYNTLVKFTSRVAFEGEQINFLVEGTTPVITDLFTNTKIEVGADGLTGTAIVSTTSGPIVVTVTGTHPYLASNDGTGLNRVVITGCSDSNANGTFFVKASTYPNNVFALYWDEALTTAVSGTGGSGGNYYVSPFYTVYDSKSTDPTVAFAPIISPFDTPTNRSMVTYSLKNVPLTSRGIQTIKFTRNGAGSGNNSVILLGIAGTGSGGGFYGDTEFQLAYVDTFSYAESGRVVGTDMGFDLLKNVGGPSVVSSGSSSVAGTKIPPSDGVLYDYTLHVRNVDGDVMVNGGLSGLPTSIDIYFRSSQEAAAGDDALYWTTLNLYSPIDGGGAGSGKQWHQEWTHNVGGQEVSTQVITIPTATYGWGAIYGVTDRDIRDPGVPAPSAYNIAMPRALAVWTANQRSFVGGVKDSAGNISYGDLYFSALGFPFRFASIQENDRSGSRLTFMGEKIRAGIMTAAAANGASIVYVLTDQSFNALGTAGGFVGSGYDATSLSTRVRVNSHGTNEPYSVAEYSGIIYYIDQEGQVIRFQGGSGQSISRHSVDDKTRNLPASRRGKASAVYWKDRYYLAYTPASGSGNTHILGWNEVMREWEFDDTLPTTATAQKLVRVFDASQTGSGQRLFLFSSDGTMYAYEEGTTEAGSAAGPAVQLRTREYQTPDLNLFRFGCAQVMVDAQASTLNVDCVYKPRNSDFRGTVDCSDTKPVAIKRESRLRTEQTSTGAPENGWSGYLNFGGNLASGTVLWRLESDVETTSLGAGER